MTFERFSMDFMCWNRMAIEVEIFILYDGELSIEFDKLSFDMVYLTGSKLASSNDTIQR